MWKRVRPGIYKHAESGRYYERTTINGRRTFRALKSHRLDAADEEMHARRTQRVRVEVGLDHAPAPWRTKTVGTILADYLAAGCPDRQRQERPADTVTQEKYRIETLEKWWSGKPVVEVNTEAATAYGVWRLRNAKKGNGRRAADMELATLSNALHFAGVSPNPLTGRAKLWKPSKARHCRDCAPVSGNEVHDIAKYLFELGPHSQVSGWLVLFQCLTGLRISELVRLRADAAKIREPGFVESARWLWLKRSKGGVNPFVVLDGRPEMAALLEAHRKWLALRYPDSPWFFPSPLDPKRAVLKSSLTHVLHDVVEKLQIGRPITSHGLRAFYVLVRRSNRIPDAQIAAEIGDKTASLIETTYGALPTDWQGGSAVAFLPASGEPAWTYEFKAKARAGGIKNGITVKAPLGTEAIKPL